MAPSRAVTGRDSALDDPVPAEEGPSGVADRTEVGDDFEISFAVPSSGPLPARVVRRVLCARVPIVTCTRDEAVEEVLHLARRERPHGADIHLCNAYTLALADRDSIYRSMLQRAHLNLADGKSVAWVNRFNTAVERCADRVRGNDLFLDVVDKGRALGVRHYLLGSTDAVVSQLATNLGRRFPDAAIVGVESPPFRPLTELERQEQIARLDASGADIVWVGLGTPKQDLAVVQLARDAGVVAVAIGAAFDFISGTKPEAPLWMQGAGLEWVHRLASEPRRLWKRYLFGNSRFLYAAVRHWRPRTPEGASPDEVSPQPQF